MVGVHVLAQEDYMMINALFKGSYEEWSCVELSIFQVCLEEQDGVDIHVHLQDIIVMNKEEMIQGIFLWAYIKKKYSYCPWRMTSSGDRHQSWEVQVQEKHLEEILLEACNPNLDIMIKWRYV